MSTSTRRWPPNVAADAGELLLAVRRKWVSMTRTNS